MARKAARGVGGGLFKLVEASGLKNPQDIVSALERQHGIKTVDRLVDVLSDTEKAKNIPKLWSLRLKRYLDTHPVSKQPGYQSSQSGTAPRSSLRPPDLPSARPQPDVNIGGQVKATWNPTADGSYPQIVVAKGDLTAANVDAIVNAANSSLLHGGGLAGAIVRNGGESIQHESSQWIQRHGQLPVGSAMSTAAGALPCKHVIHTVGPNVSHLPAPTPKHVQQLRSAVWNALVEADRLQLESIAIPGISTGIFGYPRDEGAREIVHECERYCREQPSSKLRLIVLMNFDDPTVSSFETALQDAIAEQQKRNPVRMSQTQSPRQTPHEAAGVLLVRADATGWEVLLGVGSRTSDGGPCLCIDFLGGEAADGEKPEDTGAREFSKEVGGHFQMADVLKLLADNKRSQSLRITVAKYELYIVHAGTSSTDSISADHASHKRHGAGGAHDFLVWVPWKALVVAAQQSRLPVVQTVQGEAMLSSTLRDFMQTLRHEAQQHFKMLINSGDDDLVSATKDWIL